MLTKDDPEFVDWDYQRAAIVNGYQNQEPRKVSYDLAVEAGKVADVVDRIHGKAWTRPGRLTDGTSFTVESLTRYLLSEVTDRVNDVERGYEVLAEEAEEDEGELEDEAPIDLDDED